MTRINAEDVDKIENHQDGFWLVSYYDELRFSDGRYSVARLTKSEVQHLFEKGCVDV